MSVGSALMDKCGIGGGVLVNVSEALKSCRRVDLEKDDVETVWIELRFQMKEVLCCNVYRPPGVNHGSICSMDLGSFCLLRTNLCHFTYSMYDYIIIIG